MLKNPYAKMNLKFDINVYTNMNYLFCQKSNFENIDMYDLYS